LNDSQLTVELGSRSYPVYFRTAGRTELVEPSIAVLEIEIRATITVTDQDLQDLARGRAKSIQEVLLGSSEVDPLRVFLRAPSDIAPTANSVRLKLEMKQ
jgi:hypothetical protein